MVEQIDSMFPKIRFKGFEREWEEMKLGEIVNKAVDNRGKTPPVNSAGPHPLLEVASLGGGFPDYSKVTKYVTEDTFLEWFRDHIKKDDILFSTVGNTGLVSLVDGVQEAAIAQNIVAFRGHNGNHSGFLSGMFQFKKNRDKVREIEMGAVQPSVKVSQLLNVKYKITTKPEEQTQIGGYFQELDSLIRLHQRKHDKLVTLKKSMLQKMFPLSGATTPEIRFKGFSGDWVEKRLGELSSLITKGTTPLGKSGRGLVNFVKIENINKLTGEITITSKISETEHLSYLKRSQLKTGDILFSIAGTLGRVAVVHENLLPANTNQALSIIRLAEGDVGYITTYLKGRAVDDFVKKNPTVGAQPNLSLEQVENLEVLLPTEREQIKIGTYFRTLDSLIFKHATQLQKLQQIKSACLEKMFV